MKKNREYSLLQFILTKEEKVVLKNKRECSFVIIVSFGRRLSDM